MEWFKHDTDSINNEDISDAEDLFGDAGYAVFFKMLEIYGRKFNKTNAEGYLSISLAFVKRKLRKSSTKAQQLLNFYKKRETIDWDFDPSDDSKILFKVLNFIERSSNWTKRTYVAPTEAPTEAPPFCRNTEEEVEEEVEEDLKKELGDEDLPFEIPENQTQAFSKEFISNASTLKLKDEIKDMAFEAKKIFPNVYKWIQKYKNKNVNQRSIVLALMRLNLKSQGGTIDNPWSYCTQIVEIENGNFNEADHEANRI